MVGGHPLSDHESQSSHIRESSSKAPLEHREVRDNLNVNPARGNQNARVEGSNGDSDLEFQDSREVLHPRYVVDSVTVPKSVPTTLMTTLSCTRLTELHASQHSESGESHQVLNSDIGTGAISADDLIEHTKFYQNTALGYQDTYETLHIQQKLQHRYTQQAQLVEEASEALRDAEAESSLRHQEFVNLQQQQEADIQHAIDKAMSQYQVQLSSVKSSLEQKDQEYWHS